MKKLLLFFVLMHVPSNCMEIPFPAPKVPEVDAKALQSKLEEAFYQLEQFRNNYFKEVDTTTTITLLVEQCEAIEKRLNGRASQESLHMLADSIASVQNEVKTLVTSLGIVAKLQESTSQAQSDALTQLSKKVEVLENDFKMSKALEALNDKAESQATWSEWFAQNQQTLGIGAAVLVAASVVVGVGLKARTICKNMSEDEWKNHSHLSLAGHVCVQVPCEIGSDLKAWWHGSRQP